jgi:hypothetical protein
VPSHDGATVPGAGAAEVEVGEGEVCDGEAGVGDGETGDVVTAGDDGGAGAAVGVLPHAVTANARPASTASLRTPRA